MVKKWLFLQKSLENEICLKFDPPDGVRHLFFLSSTTVKILTFLFSLIY